MIDDDRASPQGPEPANGMAIAALVLGIVSVLIVWVPIVGMLGTLMALIGLVLGVLALRGGGERGLAIGGIVCSGVSLVITAIYMLGALAIIAAAAASTR